MRQGEIAMDFIKKHRRNIIQLCIFGLLLICIDWGKEAVKALVAGGIIGSWITTKITR